MKRSAHNAKYYAANRDKIMERQRAYRKANPDRAIKQRYGLTQEGYNALLHAQNGRCAICRQLPSQQRNERRLVVDHDHKTGEVRGLLCNHCNVALGNFRDDALIVRAAAHYLEQE